MNGACNQNRAAAHGRRDRARGSGGNDRLRQQRPTTRRPEQPDPHRPRPVRRAAGGAAAGGRTVRHPDHAAAVRAGGAQRRHRRVPLLPGGSEADRRGVPDRQPVPAAERWTSCTTRSSSGSRRTDAAKAPRRSTSSSPGEGWQCFGDAGIDGDAAWVAALGAGRQRGAARAKAWATRCRPAASSSCRCTTTCWPPAASPAGTDQSSIRLRAGRRRAGHDARWSTFQLPAPVELPAPPRSPARSATAPRRSRTSSERFGERRRRHGGRADRAVQQGPAGAPAPTQHCDHPVDGAGTVYAVGRSHAPARPVHQDRAQPGHAARPHAARHPGLQLRRPGDPAAGRARRSSSAATCCGSPARTTPACASQLPHCGSCHRAMWCGATAPATRCVSAC